MRYLFIILFCVPLCAQEFRTITQVNTNRLDSILVEEPDRIILAKPKPPTTPDQIKVLSKKHGLRDKTKLKYLKWKQLEVPPGQAKKDAIKHLLDSGAFEFVQESKVYTLQDTFPNDPFFPQLWGMTNISAPRAWDSTREAPNAIVAVVDTGIDFSHPDLIDNLWTGPNGEHGYTAQNEVVVAGGLDDHGHGTHVSGTIGGTGNNGIGVCGIAWRTKIMAMKVLHGGSGNSIDIVNGLEKLVELKQAGYPILVSNHSYGGAGPDEYMKDGFRQLDQADIFAAVAAGNSNSDIDYVSAVPAEFPFLNIVSVMAHDRSNLRAYFSSYGIANCDISAPGVGVLSSTRNNTYSSWDGTSMATPHVCGTALLLRARNPGLSSHAIRDLILDPGSYDMLSSFSNNNTSAKINLDKSLRNPRLFESPFHLNSPPVVSSISPYTVVSNQVAKITFSATDPDGDTVRYGSSATIFSQDINGFLRNLASKNKLTIQLDSNTTSISSSPFSYQLANKYSASVSDNRGGGAFSSTGFEIAKQNQLRRTIGIKTWTVKTNSQFGSVTWTFDVNDAAKDDYSYVLTWAKGWGSGSWWGFTPSSSEVTASLGIDTSEFSMRVFVMDKYFNWANSERILFTQNPTVFPNCKATSSVVEGNVPFDCVFDLSASTGPINYYFVFDLMGASSSDNSQRQTNTFTDPQVRFFNAMVLNSVNVQRDSVVLPVFSSRFADIGLTNKPPLPPPEITNLVAVVDLSAALSQSGSVLLRWTDKSTNEDRYSVEASHREKGSSSPYATVAILPPNANSFTHIPNVRRSTWSYRVKACGGQLCAPNSNLASVRAK